MRMKWVKSFDGFRFVCACKCSAHRFNIVIALIDIVFGSDFLLLLLLAFFHSGFKRIHWKCYHWRFTEHFQVYYFKRTNNHFYISLTVYLTLRFSLFFVLRSSFLSTFFSFFFMVELPWIEENRHSTQMKYQIAKWLQRSSWALLVKVDCWLL